MASSPSRRLSTLPSPTTKYHIVRPSRLLISSVVFNSKIIQNKKMPKDLLHPSQAEEKQKHKLKRLIQSPNSYFMDVKCSGCFHITTIFSHAQAVIVCASCSTLLCRPTGGKCRLTEGCSFRKKVD